MSSAPSLRAPRGGLDARFFERLRAEASAGSPDAVLNLGHWLVEGARDRRGRTLLRRQPKRGVELISRVAATGHPDALVILAQCYSDGLGLPRDEVMAERLYRRAARAGHSTAAYNLSTYFRDRGDTKGERRCLRRAVALGDTSAPLTLAEIDLAGRPGGRARAAEQYLQRRARGRDAAIRDEAEEILVHFARTGRRRWAPATEGDGQGR